jgi:hypothetical protein
MSCWENKHVFCAGNGRKSGEICKTRIRYTLAVDSLRRLVRVRKVSSSGVLGLVNGGAMIIPYMEGVSVMAYIRWKRITCTLTR